MVVASVTDYLSAFLGGLCIGGAAALNMVFMGRITGLSGQFNTVAKFGLKEGFFWKYAFLVGLISAAVPLYYTTNDGAWNIGDWTLRIFDSEQVASQDLNYIGWILAGLLVGIGTKLGNGCTSGHGICGLPRLSLRSIVAVCTFMATGFLTATSRHYSGYLSNGTYWGEDFKGTWKIISGIIAILLFLSCIALAIFRLIKGSNKIEKIEMFASWIFGLLLGTGLAISGMCRRTKVTGFLTISENWDPSLAFVMGGGVMVTAVVFNIMMYKVKKPVFGTTL